MAEGVAYLLGSVNLLPHPPTVPPNLFASLCFQGENLDRRSCNDDANDVPSSLEALYLEAMARLLLALSCHRYLGTPGVILAVLGDRRLPLGRFSFVPAFALSCSSSPWLLWLLQFGGFFVASLF